MTRSVKELVKELYHFSQALDEHVASFAHAARASIRDETVRRHASLDW